MHSISLPVLADAEQLDEAERCIQSGAKDMIALPFRPIVLKARLSANL